MNKAAILVYHNIGAPPRGIRMAGIYVSPLAFAFQMWYLKVAGFKVVSLKEISDFTRGVKKTAGRLVALTFDDGYINFYEKAFPILKKYGYPATVFLVSGLAGHSNLWDHEHLVTKQKLLDWRKVEELSAAGVTFGAHTKTHPHLTRIPAYQMKNEIMDSRKEIEDRTGGQVNFFCYPYGDYNEEVLHEVREAGFLGATASKWGFVSTGDDLFELKRMGAGLKTFFRIFADI